MIPRATRAIVWSVYAAGWFVFVILELYALHMTETLSWSMAFISAITVAWPAALAGISIWPLSGQANRMNGWARFIWGQFGFALLFSLFWESAIYLQLLAFLGHAKAWGIVRGFLFWQLQFGVITYGAIAFLFYGARTLVRLREEELKAKNAEILRSRAELEALKGKLQPHFLFNTLHTLTALVRTEPKQAELALLKLGDVLRYVLQMKREGAGDEVPLAEEWAFVQQYLGIEQLRLGERLRIEGTMTPEALDCVVPIFSLQPIVENAINHAIAPRTKGGTLRFSGRVVDGLLELEVADDGPGADPVVVEESKGFGLSVVRQRLALRFPGESSVTVNTAPGQGFRVVIRCPAVEGDA